MINLFATFKLYVIPDRRCNNGRKHEVVPFVLKGVKEQYRVVHRLPLVILLSLTVIVEINRCSLRTS